MRRWSSNMPQKYPQKIEKSMNDYLDQIGKYDFYFIEDETGGYRFRGVRGNVFRRECKDFNKFMKHMPEEEKHLFTHLYGIADVERVDTGKHTLVYAIFADLQELSPPVPMPRQSILIKHLIDENKRLEIAIKQLKKLLADNNILIIVMEEK